MKSLPKTCNVKLRTETGIRFEVVEGHQFALIVVTDA